MTLSSTFGIINSAFASTAAQSAVISSNISTSIRPDMSAKSPTRSRRLWRFRSRFDHATGQQRAAGSAQDVDLGIGRADRDLDGFVDPGPNRRRQRLDDGFDRRAAERQFSVGDARQSAGRLDDLCRDAQQHCRRPGGADGRAGSDLIAECRQRSGATGSQVGVPLPQLELPANLVHQRGHSFPVRA